MLCNWTKCSPAVMVLAASTLAAGTLAPAAAGAQSTIQVSPRLTQPIDEAVLTPLHGGVHPLARPEYDRGPVDDSLSGRMLLMLKPSPEQERAMRQLVEDQQDPASPNFHKWLTPEEFGKRFGVADADIQTVAGYLAAHGFKVGRTYKNKTLMEVEGTAAQLRETFHVEIHSYSAEGREFHANAGEPQIPAALAPVVRGFASLNDFNQTAFGEANVQTAHVAVDEQHHRVKPEYQTTNSGGIVFNYLMPADIETIYNIPTSTGSAGAGGNGVTVGVVGDSQVNLNPIARYRSLGGLPSVVPSVIIDGQDPTIATITGSFTAPADSTIAYTQLELIGAAAPYASLNYYVSATTAYDAGINFAIVRAVEDDAVSVLTIGFQSCESNLTAINAALVENAWLQAAAQGITVVAATGDSGAAGCDTPVASSTNATGGLAVNGYASPAYDVAVGGTDFYFTSNYYSGNNAQAAYFSSTNGGTYGNALSYVPEQAWNDNSNIDTANYYTSTVFLEAGGGGFSTLGSTDGATQAPYAVPSWQVAAQQHAGVSTPTARSIPDVAMFAGLNYNTGGYVICQAYTDCVSTVSSTDIGTIGSTAGAAAVFAGIMAQVVEKYGQQGNANPALYYLQSTSPSIFHDITKGGNSVACSGGTGCSGGYLMTGSNYAYNAGTGYDFATGLGSVNATSLIAGWKSPASKSSTTALTVKNYSTGATVASGTSVVHGTPLNLTGTVTGSAGTPTGNVAFTTNSPLADYTGIYAAPLVSGVGTATDNMFLPGGSYNLYARYGGDSTYTASVSSPTAITVTPEPSQLLYEDTSPASGASGLVFGQPVQIVVEPYSLNANNVSTPTGTVAVYYYNNSATPIALLPLSSEGTATFSTDLIAGGAFYNLNFVYSGDASYKPSQTWNGSTSSPSGLYSIYVGQAMSTMTLLASGSTSASAPVTLTATVAPAAGTYAAASGIPPTGTVTFNAPTAFTVNLSPGFSTTGQPIGTAAILLPPSQVPANGTITATYNGDTNYSGSTASQAISINNTSYSKSSSLAASFSASSSVATQTVSTSQAVTFYMTPTEGTITPSGTIRIYANSVLVGTVSVNSAAQVSYTIPLSSSGYLPFNSSSGFVLITCSFTPASPLYAPTTNDLGLTVTDDRTPSDFALATDLQSVSLNSSTNAAFVRLQVSDLGNLSGLGDTVNLTCSVLPAGSNLGCSLMNGSVTFSTTANNQLIGSQFTALEIYGEPTGGTGALHSPIHQQRWWMATGGPALACIVLLGIPARRKGLQGIMTVLLCVALVSGAITGCGGRANLPADALESGNQLKGSGQATANFTNGLSTNTVAPGTYTVIVTGTSASNTSMVHNTVVKVTMGTGVSIPNGTYAITSYSSMLLLTDPSANTASGTGLVQNASDGTADQKWTFTYQGNGYYTIQNASSGLYLTDPGGAASTGSTSTQVTQASALTDGSQYWTLNVFGGGYQIVNAESGGALDNYKFEASAGTEVICYPQKTTSSSPYTVINQGENQIWSIY